MPRKSPHVIVLSLLEREELDLRSRAYTQPYYVVIRARMILMAADGVDNNVIAAQLQTRREIVSYWRKRFQSERLNGLNDRPRQGRPCRRSEEPKL